MKLSVIIPTYNRKNVLTRCLNALFEQTCSKTDFEILVVDDGSNDGTNDIVKKIMAQSPVQLKYFKQENRGPGAARNIGIKNASGKIIQFIGDDIVASPSLIDAHLNWHEQYSEENVAILGHVTWSPDVKITPFMRWLESGGPQFAFYRFSHGQDLEPEAFYTSNISLKKSFLLSHGLFDEEFPYAAYEDTELSYRLTEKGLRVIYNGEAVAYHFHPMTIRSYCNRMKEVGESFVILFNKHPRSDFSQPCLSPSFKKIVKLFTFPLYKYLLSFIDNYVEVSLPQHYRRILDYYKIKGIERNIFKLRN